MSMRQKQDPIQNYLESLIPPLSPALESIKRQLMEDQKWGINIGAVEGRLLQFLIKAFQIKNVLEIGTQYGYSTQWMLEALPADGKILTLEKDPAHHQQARSLIQDGRVEFILGDALETAPQLLNRGPFDLVFIDANKKAYHQYLKLAKQAVVSGGMIIGDNTFLFGTVWQNPPPDETPLPLWQAMRAFNQEIFADPLFDSCIIPTGEGLTVGLKK